MGIGASYRHVPRKYPLGGLAHGAVLLNSETDMRASNRVPNWPGDTSALNHAVRRVPFREHEVALLVAAGLPNAEIARQLGLSPSTVGTYLQHIRQRLGLDSRAAIAAWVTD